MKVLTHFLHIQYECGMQSVAIYSLNHDATTSFGLRLTPIFQNLAPPLYRYNFVRVHANTFPQHMKVLKHFIYMHYGCVMQSGVVYSLNKVKTMLF